LRGSTSFDVFRVKIRAGACYRRQIGEKKRKIDELGVAISHTGKETPEGSKQTFA